MTSSTVLWLLVEGRMVGGLRSVQIPGQLISPDPGRRSKHFSTSSDDDLRRRASFSDARPSGRTGGGGDSKVHTGIVQRCASSRATAGKRVAPRVHR